MNWEVNLRIVGVLQILLAFLHAAFPNRFNWQEELGRLSLLNPQMFVVHNGFLCYCLIAMGSLTLFFPEELLDARKLAKLSLIGFGVFWGLRLICQWFIYDSALWRGLRFNTSVHILFSGLWVYFTSIYFGALFLRLL